MTPNEQTALDWIATQQQHMVFLTESWSSINSGSYHTAGVRAQAKALADNFLWLGGEIAYHPMAPYSELDAGGNLIEREIAEAMTITKRPEAPIQVLLGGHMDTVYGVDHPFQKPRYISETIMNGPGVADLKGGLVVMLKALEALERHPDAARVGWQVVLNPDEEIGSISSDPLLKQCAQGKHLGMIYEPALADGTLAGARKGSGNFSLRIAGRAAHAGRNPEEGRNAVVAASECIAALSQLNGKREGVTFNPARLDGGGPLNMVPDMAIVRFNVRILNAEDADWVLGEIDAILAQVNQREGYSATRYGSFTRPPKPMSPENQKLVDFVQECGRAMGLSIGVKPSGGCCDGNNLWRHGLANVDTLGVRGAHIHSSDEIVHLDSLVERAQLSALMLMKLASGEFTL